MNKKNKKQKKNLGLTFVRQKETKALPLYHIEWRDHAVSGSVDSWLSVGDIVPKALTCFSVGFQVAEDQESIAIAQNVSERGQAAEIMTILKSCIVKKTLL